MKVLLPQSMEIYPQISIIGSLIVHYNFLIPLNRTYSSQQQPSVLSQECSKSKITKSEVRKVGCVDVFHDLSFQCLTKGYDDMY